MNNKAWSQLPNASHIDWVMQSVKNNPGVWAAALDATWSVARARFAARSVSRGAAWSVARGAARCDILNTARITARDAAWGEVLEAAWSAIAALVAWDDSSQFLEMNSDKLEVYAKLSDDPRAILLLPAVRAFERIKELDSV